MASPEVREESIGQMAVFLVPSLKLKEREGSGSTVEERIHKFLLQSFGGYTAAAGNIFGYWTDDDGKHSYGEHKEYKVGLREDSRLSELKHFLASIARDLDEECIYLEAGKQACFIYAQDGRDS